MTSYFKLPYWISNNGDGSASIRPEPTFQIAEEKDEEQGGWGEACAGTISLKVEDGVLYYESYDYVDGKYQKTWKKVLEKE